MISASKASAIMVGLDLSGFTGEWVALEGEKILAHGKNLKTIYSKIKGTPLSKVLFAKVPGNETMIL